MTERKELSSPAGNSGGQYFANPSPDTTFISSGSTLLDCVLGGGYAMGRIVNIIGDRSAGKTLLAIEASANFAATYPDGKIWYNEIESAFDTDYARALGMPVDHIDFVDGEEEKCFTVEDVFEHLETVVEELAKNTVPGLYILDSLDALSDRAEQQRDMNEGTYGAEKAKKMSQLFRRLVGRLGDANVTVLIISQVRDNIGVAFGKKYTRSGGRALDFYSSQVIELAHIARLKRTRKGVERPIGVRVRAKCEKNKVGLPFRECEFIIQFGFGVDDLQSNLEWIKKEKLFKDVDMAKDDVDHLLKTLNKLPDDEYFEYQADLAEAVKDTWREIEIGFLPTRRKYSE